MNSESANPKSQIQNPKSPTPTFPKYYGELPPVLSPLNLRHYFLLAYWVYFRPTALKVYLYQADPDLYRVGPGREIFRMLRVPAYRNLYVMTPGVVLLLSILAGLPFMLGGMVMGNVTLTDWGMWVLGALLGVVLSVGVGVAFGVVWGVGGGATFGMAIGIAGGVTFGAAVGIAFGVAGGIVFHVVALTVLSMALGVGFGVVVGMGFGVVFSLVFGLIASVVVGVAAGITRSTVDAVIVGVAFGVGALRCLFYLCQLPLAWRSGITGKHHPAEGDEFAILPLPWAQQALRHRLEGDAGTGLHILADVSRDPFQRWAAQKTLSVYLHAQPAPVDYLYGLLGVPELQDYIQAPVRPWEWGRLPSSRQVIFAELGGLDCSRGFPAISDQRYIWLRTRFLRDRRVTPLTRFAGMLYELLDEEAVDTPEFDLATYAPIYTGLSEYPGGAEIADTFSAMAAFLRYDKLLDLTHPPGPLPSPHYGEGRGREAAVRPAVLAALERLAYVGAEVAAYRDATSRVNRLAALARAAEAIETLDAYVAAEVGAPEQALLRRIVRQWRRLVSEAGGQVGRATVSGPVVNPYVVGNPVTGALFVGREDILRRLEELWGGPGVRPSVILYGHRRMGKSSILHNLGARFGAETRVVDFNMQRVGMVATTGELLYNLALAMTDVLRDRAELAEPEEVAFTAHNPYTAFDRFLKRVEAARSAVRFIVAVDEFELLEQRIAEGQVEARLLDYWRGLIHTYPWFVLAFAGLHTLEEMRRDYWNPLFGSVTPISVSFLDAPATRRLLTDPGDPDFALDYDQDVLDHVYTLTHGQPYLVQLIGHTLVTRYNRQTYEAGIARAARFTLEDVTAVLASPEFYLEGDAYFTGVWRQAAQGAPGQQPVLRALAHAAEGLAEAALAQQTGSPAAVAGEALATLRAHDVLVQNGDRWQFTVELMRRWVADQVA